MNEPYDCTTGFQAWCGLRRDEAGIALIVAGSAVDFVAVLAQTDSIHGGGAGRFGALRQAFGLDGAGSASRTLFIEPGTSF